jgi:hypothetical protein
MLSIKGAICAILIAVSFAVAAGITRAIFIELAVEIGP